MTHYTVSLVVDFEAETPEEAAEMAREWLSNTKNVFFDVLDNSTHTTTEVRA